MWGLAGCGKGWLGGSGLRWRRLGADDPPITEPFLAGGQEDQTPVEQPAPEPADDEQPQHLGQPSGAPGEEPPLDNYTASSYAASGPEYPLQWPRRGQPGASVRQPGGPLPTPAEQIPTVPSSAVPVGTEPTVTATQPAPSPRRVADSTAAEPGEIEQVMAAGIAGRAPRMQLPPADEPSRSSQTHADAPAPLSIAPAAGPPRPAGYHTAPPPVEALPPGVGEAVAEPPSQIPLGPPPGRGEPADLAASQMPAEPPSQIPLGPPPGTGDPVDLAASQMPDEPPDDDGVESLADLVAPSPADAGNEAAPAAPPARQGTTELVAASMVQVNDSFITVDDVLTGLHGELLSMPRAASEEAFREAVTPIIEQRLRQLVYEALVLTEAQANLTGPQKEFIDGEVADARREMIARAGGSEQALEQYYRDRHTTLDRVLEEHRNRLTGRLYLQTRIEPGIVITRDMLLDYYRRHTDDFVVERRVQMQVVAAPFQAFLPDVDGAEPTPVEWQRARRQAREVIDAAAAAIMAGDDFGEVARNYSRGFHARDGGVWPLMAEGSFRETEVERNAFALDEGEICGIIETENGYYIVKALKVEPGQSVGFEESQEEIDGILREQQYDELASNYFMKLFGEATIAQSDEFMEMAIDGVVGRYWYRD